MKLSAILLTILVQATSGKLLTTDRKVPPRHPQNRLARLQQFALEFISANFDDNPNKRKIITQFTNSMQQSFDRTTCGYYDPSSSVGGPDPQPEIRESGRARNPATGRNRREDDWMTETCLCEQEGKENCFDELSDAQYNYYVDSSINEMFCDEDEVSNGSCAYLNMQTCEWVNKDNRAEVRGKNGSHRLSNDPIKALKQITTGIRKWADRYLNNCHGMRLKRAPSTRARRIYRKWIAELEA